MQTDANEFDVVAESCESQLEAIYGPEIDMTFATAVRTLGRLAAADDAESGTLTDRVERLLGELSVRILDRARSSSPVARPLEPSSEITNLIYDPGR